MKISVIIVSYNCKAFLDYCIQSVFKALKNIEGEIIVVDNCSSDGSVEYIKSKKYNLKIIENDINLGFSKANNKASKLAGGDYLFFLNPDTIIPEDLINNFVENKKRDTGIFGFRMIDGQGSFLRESKRNFPNIRIISKKLLGFRSDYYSSLNEFDSGVVDVLCGANMIIKKSVFDEINGFNEEYFMFGEDIEISHKISKCGYKNYYCGSSSIIHFKGQSTINDVSYLKNFYGAMNIYYKNVFSSNLFFLTIIKIISSLFIFFKKFSPLKTKINTDSKFNLLFSDKPNNKLKKLYENISTIEQLEESLNNCNLIFDPNYLTFKEIIKCIDNLKNKNKINFWFLSSDNTYMIKAGGMNQKGNTVFL